MAETDNDTSPGFASPPCFAHELVFSEHGCHAIDPVQAADVQRWRKAERQRLVKLRQNTPPSVRIQHAAEITDKLNSLIDFSCVNIISVYWPIRGELDFRFWMKELCSRGCRVVLPVIEARNAPLVFREWRPESRLERAIWNIPAPVEGEVLVPDAVISPLVGFDQACFRLGNGGGYFDRTLASFNEYPQVFGVGQSALELATIFPQWHDVPMNYIVCEGDTMYSRAA